MKKKLIGALAGFLAIMLIFTLLSRAADSIGVPRVRIAKAEKQVITHSISAAGKVIQNQEQAVFTEANQRIKSICVKEGASVEEGDLLFEIDLEDLAEQIVTAQENIEKEKLQQQDTLSANEASAVNRAANQSSAAADYQDAVSEGDAAVWAAKEAWDAAEENLKNYQEPGAVDGTEDTVLTTLQQTCEEKTSLYEEAVAAREEVEKEIEDKIAEVLAEAQTEAAGTKLEAQVRKQYATALKAAQEKEEKAENAKQTAETALTDYQDSQKAAAELTAENGKAQLEQQVADTKAAYEQAVKERDSGIKNAAKGVQNAAAAEGSNSSAEVTEIGIEQAERNLAKLEKLKEYGGKITAPVKGIVTKINITVGERTTDGTAVLLADASSGLRFTAQISGDEEKYIARLDEVLLKPDNNGKEIKGLTVDTIRVNSDDSSLLDVTVQLPENTLEMGTGATLQVVKKSEPYNLCIPLSALYQDSNQQYYVFIMEETETILGKEQTVRRVDVTVVDKNAQYAALAEGAIAADQNIVTDSEKMLEAGDRVRLNES